MIICDVDNISDQPSYPSQETIQEELRRQTEALKDVRRRLREVVGPRAVGSVLPRA